MATLKPCVKNDYVKCDGKCNIKIRLSHDRKVGYLKTPYCIEPSLLWKDGRIKRRHPDTRATDETGFITLLNGERIILYEGAFYN